MLGALGWSKARAWNLDGVDTPLQPLLIYAAVVALNLKKREVERLQTAVARLTGESTTEAIRRALEERRSRLIAASGRGKRARILKLLHGQIWPSVPKKELERRLTRTRDEVLLGTGLTASEARHLGP
jgi:antitoxin VapB